MATIIEYILTQQNSKQRVEKFGKKAEESTDKELGQIHNKHECITTIRCKEAYEKKMQQHH